MKGITGYLNTAVNLIFLIRGECEDLKVPSCM